METIQIVPKFLDHRTLSAPKPLKGRKGKFGVLFPLDASNIVSKVAVD